MATFFQVVLLLVAVPLLVASTVIRSSGGPQEIQNNGVDLQELEKKVNPEGAKAACKTNDSRPIGGLSGNAAASSRWNKTQGYFVQLDPKSTWTEDEMKLIEGALFELGKAFCVPILMWPRTSKPSGDYVLIQKGGAGTGCYATNLGRAGGMQRINLEVPGCLSKGIVMHENIHSLGFNHEQTRPDRDQYIKVYTTEIQDGNAQYQYKTYAGSLTFGVPYDYSSIMHYGSYDFTKRGNPTMRRKDNNAIIVKQRKELTDNDKAKLKAMYKC